MSANEGTEERPLNNIDLINALLKCFPWSVSLSAVPWGKVLGSR